MLVSDFDYELPEELIAQTPIEPRNASRLMVLAPESKTVLHRRFEDLSEFLRHGDLLVFNDTRVIPARLVGRKDKTGAKVELLLLRRLEEKTWEALIKPGKKTPPGAVLKFGEKLSCRVESRTDYGGRIVSFSCYGIFDEVLAELGETPLPPYIREKLADVERYQTVYGKVPGSAAAPTAGLHFTNEQLAKLKGAGINLCFLTLHVGLGTFRPVKAENIEDHAMHSEFYSIDESAARLIREAKAEGRRVIAVGTTSVRTLEAAADGPGKIRGRSGETNIFIYPGYDFKIVDAMITNFHLPKSTLIMLVSAFAGRDFTLAAYREAVRERYRFFSFGDAMFITERARRAV